MLIVGSLYYYMYYKLMSHCLHLYNKENFNILV